MHALLVTLLNLLAALLLEGYGAESGVNWNRV